MKGKKELLLLMIQTMNNSILFVLSLHRKPPMNHNQSYSTVPHIPASRLQDADGSMRPHTYGVHPRPCAVIATEPYRPTACAGEHPYPAAYTATAHYSLLTANSPAAPPAPPAHPILHSTFFILHWSYTFSAKEKDSETGLSYFGSRYYSSDLSIWLSVDPMSDKYPHQSNYVYCSNNPLKVIDPNGEDEWEVNETGYIRHIHNDKPNRLYAVSGTQKGEWGERKSDVKPLDVNESIMNSIQTQGVNTSFFTENNREDMNGLFDFLADNTNVEWTQISSHLDGNKYDFLTTSHDNITTELPPGLNVHLNYAASKGFLDVLKHSHPNKYTGDNYYLAGIYPLSSNIRSEGDLNTKAILVQKNIQKNGFVRNLPLFILRNRGKNYEY